MAKKTTKAKTTKAKTTKSQTTKPDPRLPSKRDLYNAVKEVGRFYSLSIPELEALDDEYNSVQKAYDDYIDNDKTIQKLNADIQKSHKLYSDLNSRLGKEFERDKRRATMLLRLDGVTEKSIQAVRSFVDKWYQYK